MPAASGLADFSREGNRLLVRGTLGINENDAFYPALMELLKSGHSEVVLDLSGVDYMSSICIGSIAVLMTRASQRDVAATVVAHGRIVRFLEAAGLSMLGDIRVVE